MFLFVIHVVVSTYDFEYGAESDHSPPRWKYTPGWGHCGDSHQSPININTQLVTESDGIPEFQLKGSRDIQVDGHFENNGHAPTFLIDSDSVGKLQLLSEGKAYDFRNLHFHFGVDPNIGSEHSVNGMFHPAEAHLVHTGTDNGIVVIAVFLTLQEDGFGEQNTEVTQIMKDYIKNITKPDDRTPAVIRPYNILPDNPHFFTYSGSLTTPPCTEQVRWIVMQEPIIISGKSLAILRSIYGHEGPMSDDGNRRPIQRKDEADVSVGELNL